MRPSPDDAALLNHFTFAIYPFLHTVPAEDRSARLQALASRWKPWWSRLSDADLAEALDATGFFLPYVRGLLYPELLRLDGAEPGEGYAHWADLVRRDTQTGLASFAGRLPHAAILHLTYGTTALQALAEFTVVWRRTGTGTEEDSADLSACLDWVDALVFPSGIGFLILKVRMRTEQPRLGQLIELNQAIRLVHRPTLRWSLPVLHFPRGQKFTVRELINDLTRGLVQAGPVDGGDRPASRVPYTETEAGRSYGERCQLLSYACTHFSDADGAALPAGVFRCGTERLLFEYATGIGLGRSVHNPIWVPSPEQAERFRQENRLAPWRCWQAMALQEACVFLGTEDLRFNRESLPRNIEYSYMPLYLFTLYQKLQLLIFANDLMCEVAQVESHVKGARQLLRRFVAFRNRFWFNEVTRKPQGGELYRLMQQSLDVRGLYEMVVASVKEAKEYYEDRWDRQVRFGLTILGLGGPIAAAVGALRVALGFASWPVAAGAMFGLGAAAAGAWLLWRRRVGNRSQAGLRSRKRRNRTLRLPMPGSERGGRWKKAG